MVKLVPNTPLKTLLPLSVGGLKLSESPPRQITAILPYAGQEQAFATALKKAHDLDVPKAGFVSGKAALRLVWSGHAEYFLIGAKPASKTLAGVAALVDQSDGWASMRLEGVGFSDVMARLCPVDLRADKVKQGRVVLTELAHMAARITRLPKGVEIMVGRSFARTAVARLRDAMESIAAQVDLKAAK